VKFCINQVIMNKTNYKQILFYLLPCMGLLGSMNVSAQESIQLSFNPKINHKYVYRTESLADNGMHSIVFSSFEAQKKDKNTFSIHEKFESMDAFDDDDHLFSFNCFLDPTEDRYYLQGFLKSLEMKRDISKNGEIVSGYNFNQLIDQSFYKIGLDKDDLKIFLDAIEKNGNYFFLNRNLTKGDSITEVRSFKMSGISRGQFSFPVTYRILNITKDQTVIYYHSQGNFTAYSRSYSVAAQGLVIVENSTGLPLYLADITKVGEEIKMVNVINRDDFKNVNPNAYFSGYYNQDIWYGNGGYEQVSSNSREFLSVNIKEAEKKLADLDLHLFLKTKSDNRYRMGLGSADDCSNITFAINDFELNYCNKETRLVQNKVDELVEIFPLEGFTEIKTAGACKECDLRSIALNVTANYYYESDSMILYPKDVGRTIDSPYLKPYIAHWTGNVLVYSFPGFYIAYNSKGEAIEVARVLPYTPFVEETKQLFGTDDVSVEQTFLCSVLFDSPGNNYYYEYTYQEPVSKVAVYFPSKLITKTYRLSSQEVDEKVADKIKKNARQRRKEYEKRLAVLAESHNEKHEQLIDTEEPEDEEDLELEPVLDANGNYITRDSDGADNSEYGEMVSEEDQVFIMVEQMPEFTGGGDQAMRKYIADNIQYPQEAIDNEMRGRVYISFIIEKDGSVNEVKVVRGVYAPLDKEAVRIIENMPKWSPGVQRGQNVRVSFTVPVNFSF